MKRYGALIALIVALGFGLMAVLLANKWLTSRSQQMAATQKEVVTVKVVVAARDLDIGTPLSPENLTVSEWPKESVPKGAVHDIAEVKDRTILSKMWAGEPVLTQTLAAPGSGAGMVATISPGMRAMAVQVDEVTGVGGFILPNTYVDIIAVEVQGKSRTVRTLLNRIKVLAIAQETFKEDGKPKIVKTVTVELTPREAEKLALQINEGNIHLALRNPLDDFIIPHQEEKPVIVSRPAPVRTVYVAKKPEPAYQVEVIRRSKRESLNFKDGESDEKL